MIPEKMITQSPAYRCCNFLYKQKFTWSVLVVFVEPRKIPPQEEDGCIIDKLLLEIRRGCSLRKSPKTKPSDAKGDLKKDKTAKPKPAPIPESTDESQAESIKEAKTESTNESKCWRLLDKDANNTWLNKWQRAIRVDWI